jgi:hypothetical protein
LKDRNRGLVLHFPLGTDDSSARAAEENLSAASFARLCEKLRKITRKRCTREEQGDIRVGHCRLIERLAQRSAPIASTNKCRPRGRNPVIHDL